MIRYGYNQQIVPPAPFVHVTLRCRETGKEAPEVPAQVDPGADRTVIPARIVQELGLVPLDELQVSGFGGQVFLLPTYRLEVNIRSFQPLIVEVFAHADEPFVLLGRDVLNAHRILLDGPRLMVEIE
ncbi:MAG TPA: retroviral-like aspartic protease family protein [Gemmataceae bacterium]|nr:retroviral-like aspartic protease family protein [Gemmataceae bacterium]